jgi:hypothetical protein
MVMKHFNVEFLRIYSKSTRWAARPMAMARHGERTVLVLEDPRGGCPSINCSVAPWT